MSLPPLYLLKREEEIYCPDFSSPFNRSSSLLLVPVRAPLESIALCEIIISINPRPRTPNRILICVKRTALSAESLRNVNQSNKRARPCSLIFFLVLALPQPAGQNEFLLFPRSSQQLPACGASEWRRSVHFRLQSRQCRHSSGSRSLGCVCACSALVRVCISIS